MILQALNDYYRRKCDDADPAQRLPAFGLEQKEIPFVLEITNEGELVQLVDTRTLNEKKKKIGQSFRVPQGVKIVAQFEMCEDLAEQGRAYCRRKMAEGVVANEGAALERLHTGLQGKDWCTAEQKTWIVQRVAELQGWVVPASVPALLSGK